MNWLKTQDQRAAKKMVNFDNHYRIRVGDYRVIYKIFDAELIVDVIKVGHRKDVYR